MREGGMKWKWLTLAQARRAGVLMMPLRGVSRQSTTLYSQAAQELVPTLGVAQRGLILTAGVVNTAHEVALPRRHLAKNTLCTVRAGKAVSDSRRCPRPTEEFATATRAGVRLLLSAPRSTIMGRGQLTLPSASTALQCT